jgi:hypothetical protein
LFINDKHEHIQQVEKTCQEKGISFIGLRYGYLDDQVEAFSPQIASIQMDYFNNFQLMSDVEAGKKGSL